MGIQSAALHQLGMGALLPNGAILQNQYLIRLHGVGKSAGYCDGGLARAQIIF